MATFNSTSENEIKDIDIKVMSSFDEDGRSFMDIMEDSIRQILIRTAC